LKIQNLRNKALQILNIPFLNNADPKEAAQVLACSYITFCSTHSISVTESTNAALKQMFGQESVDIIDVELEIREEIRVLDRYKKL